MPEVIRKIFEAKIAKVSDRAFEFTAATDQVDREGESIDVRGLDTTNFLKNPVVVYAHDYHGLPVGRAPKVWIDGGDFRNIVEFPPEGTYEFADIVKRLVDTGFLKAESIGFIPLEWIDGDGEKTPRRKYNKAELLEISIVPVPANPDALAVAKAKGIITDKEYEIITKPEETENYIRIPAPGEEGKHDGHRIRTIDLDKSEGIKALYCGECKVVITYLFSKDHNWTMERAKKWVEEHSKGLTIDEKGITQAEIRDELDYLTIALKTRGLGDGNKELAWDLVREVMRLRGSDIPLDIIDKIGAVLNKKNFDRLEQIKALAQEVIDSAHHEPQQEEGITVANITAMVRAELKTLQPEVSKEDIVALVHSELPKAIRKAQGRI